MVRRGALRSTAAAAALGALAALTAASARAETVVPVEGPWTGATSVGLAVNFNVEGGNVVDAHFGFHWGYCGDFQSHEPNVDPIDPEGHWSFPSPEGQTIEGTFVAPNRVEGTIVTVERELPGCPETRATFIAIPGETPPPTPPQYYAVTNVITGFEQRMPREMTLRKGLRFWLWQVKWTNWGKSVAYGNGHASIMRFKKRWNPAVHVRLSRPIADGPHKRLYSVMRWTLTGPVPARFPRHGELKFHAPR